MPLPPHPRTLALLLLLALACDPPAAHAHGAIDEKIARLRAALLSEPGNAALRFELAAVHQEHGDWQIALGLLDKVEELAPEKFATGLVRGRALADGGRFAEARAALDEYIQNFQQDAAARLARARVLSELGEAVKAADDATMARTLSPDPDAALLLALADYHNAARRPAEALETLEEAQKKFGPIPVIVERLVQLELALERPAQAVARLAAQIAAVPPAQRPP